MKFIEITLHRRCTSVHFSIQPTRTPASDGRPRVRGRLVGQSAVSNFSNYSGAQIHSFWGRAFQAVGSANCVISVSTPRSVVWAGYWNTMYVIFRPHLATCHVSVVLFVNNHKNRNRPWTAVFI